MDLSRLGYREPKHPSITALRPSMRFYGRGILTKLLRARKEKSMPAAATRTQIENCWRAFEIPKMHQDNPICLQGLPVGLFPG